MLESMKSALMHLVPRETATTSLDMCAQVSDNLCGERRLLVAASVVHEPASELFVQRGVLATGTLTGYLDQVFIGAERDVLHARPPGL